MRIGIDARLLTYRRGIGNVVFHLLHGLSELSDDCSYVIYVDDPSAKELVPDDARFSVRTLRPKFYPAWEQISLPLRVARDKLDILHCPGNTAPVYLPDQVKLVLTIHDVMYLFPASILHKSPSFYQRVGREYLRRIVPFVARRAASIITISESSREDILKYLHVPEERINVVSLAANGACQVIADASLLITVRKKYSLDSPFMLALGAIDPRKNSATIMKAYARFKQQNSGPSKLAIIGLPVNGMMAFKRLAEELGISDEVVLTGFVTDDDLVALYNAAELLIYPSLYEGFGLPVLEAMKCGTPVITSPSGSIPEISGDAAVMVNPLDVDEIAAAMKRVTTDKVLHRHLVAKGKTQAEKFSWQRTAEKTSEIYRNVMAG